MRLDQMFLDAISGGGAPPGDLLEAASELHTDPLRVLAHRSGLSETEIFARAAALCDLAFAPSVPASAVLSPMTARLESIANIRSIQARLLDRDILFTAPTFQRFLALWQDARAGHPRRQAFCVVPPRAIRAALVAHNQHALMDNARQRLARQWPLASAHLELHLSARILFTLGLGAMVAMAVATPIWAVPYLLPPLALILLLPAWFRLSAIFDEPFEPDGDGEMLGDAGLPIYTILIPLRNESAMVPALVEAMRALDYPPEKLDIKFVVEQSSPNTVSAVRACLGDPRFELIEVPRGPPFTKPKALNFALPMVRGEHLVVYDAEDVPAPNQLRLAATRFAAEPEIDCLQAELFVDNAAESTLTALFAAEYSGLFGLMLPALARRGLPMPLGGTSNHFRVASLQAAGAWDAFNVTEDADLGVRLVRLGFRSATLHSRTYEEAPATLGAWTRQRTRWLKGWMQTFIVHNRHPRRFLAEAGLRNFVVFQIYVGGMIFSAPLHLAFLVSLLAWSVTGTIFPVAGSPFGGGIHLLVLISGYFGAAALSLVGATRRNDKVLMIRQLALPLYWALIGVAALRAAVELVVNPFYWAKTAHGTTGFDRTGERLGASAADWELGNAPPLRRPI